MDPAGLVLDTFATGVQEFHPQTSRSPMITQCLTNQVSSWYRVVLSFTSSPATTCS